MSCQDFHNEVNVGGTPNPHVSTCTLALSHTTTRRFDKWILIVRNCSFNLEKVCGSLLICATNALTSAKMVQAAKKMGGGKAKSAGAVKKTIGKEKKRGCRFLIPY